MIFFFWVSGAGAQDILHHALEVQILHDTKTLRGSDTIRLPKGMSRLQIALRPGVRILGVEGADYADEAGELHLTKSAGLSSHTVVLNYEGVFNDPFEAEPFSLDNPGQGVIATITRNAAFFLGGSGWYPVVMDDIPQTFEVSVTAPKGIYAVMEGRLNAHADRADHSISTWSVTRPSGPLAMFAGRWQVKSRQHGRVRIATYFSLANAGLSKTYLDAVQQHLTRYEALHGPYPFSKFAVVENFFPTGYGFPSFTLLGSRVLRLPFIPHISLRHEVAHCWWGNGVLVDPDEGNWSEGLTTYVADYLSKEEASLKAARHYRMGVLEKYAHLASGNRDFALSRFRSRSGPASQAIGYGKAMFVFHMIRQQIGDSAFWAALRHVYASRLHKPTGWRHFMDAFARQGRISAQEIRIFHDQWITRPGALQLAMESPRLVSKADQKQVSAMLVQTEPGYRVSVPVTVKGPGINQRQAISLWNNRAEIVIPVQGRPQTIAADPDFDLFRLLDPGEIPPTVNALKGAGALTAVLANDTPKPWAKVFKGLLSGLNHGGAEILSERQFAAKETAGRDLIFFGMPKKEKGRSLLSALADEALLSARAFQVGETISSRNSDTLFAVFKRQQRLLAVFLPKEGTDVKTVTGTARKITHYGRWGRLSFEKGINISRGVGKGSGSPLVVNLEEGS